VITRGKKNVRIHRAQDTVLNGQDDLEISATVPFPRHETLAEAGAMFTAEAQDLADALVATLPGGTIDALIVRLLDHKRSHFVVAHAPLKGRT
jgi:hypothetical protein